MIFASVACCLIGLLAKRINDAESSMLELISDQSPQRSTQSTVFGPDREPNASYLVYTVQEIPPELNPHCANVPLRHRIPNQRHFHIEGTQCECSCLDHPGQQQIAEIVVMVMLPGCREGMTDRGGGGGSLASQGLGSI